MLETEIAHRWTSSLQQSRAANLIEQPLAMASDLSPMGADGRLVVVLAKRLLSSVHGGRVTEVG